MLKAAGFDQPPTTWDEFDKICTAVSKPPDTYCYAFIPNASTFVSWIWSRGGEYATSDEKAAAFNDSAGIDTLTWLKNQHDMQWAYQPAGAYGDTTDFGNGKVAFTFSMSSGLPYYSDAVSGSQHPFKWGIAPFPAGSNGKQVVNSYNTSMAILKTTPEKQRAAWLWIKFMLSEKGGTDWALATAYFPTAQSTLNALNAMDEATAQAANPDFAKILGQYKLATNFATFGRAEPLLPAWQGARTIIENMMIAVFTGKSGADFQATDPTAAAAEGVQRVNDALSQYGK
jgi:ABC-type glycerol-3-phosphate transport system substrate-binding protein